MTLKVNIAENIAENIKVQNPDWSPVPVYPYRILIIGSSGSTKTNVLLNLISHQPAINKKFLYINE